MRHLGRHLNTELVFWHDILGAPIDVDRRKYSAFCGCLTGRG